VLERPATWTGDNPFYLLISLAAGGVAIDLDAPGWATRYADYLRVKSIWYLVRKADEGVVLAVTVNEGEQPYYTARHVGVAQLGRGDDGDPLPVHEVIFFGIGKKRLDGHVDRLWVGPRGLVCGGDDPEQLGRHLLGVMLAMEEARKATEQQDVDGGPADEPTTTDD